jgi:hypothetical protein
MNEERFKEISLFDVSKIDKFQEHLESITDSELEEFTKKVYDTDFLISMTKYGDLVWHRRVTTWMSQKIKEFDLTQTQRSIVIDFSRYLKRKISPYRGIYIFKCLLAHGLKYALINNFDDFAFIIGSIEHHTPPKEKSNSGQLFDIDEITHSISIKEIRDIQKWAEKIIELTSKLGLKREEKNERIS